MVKPRQPLFQPAEPLFLGRIKMQCNVVINCFLSHFCTHSFPLTKFWSLVFHFFLFLLLLFGVVHTVHLTLIQSGVERDSRGSLFAIKMNFLLYPLPSKTVKTKPERPVCGHSPRRRDISGLLRAENERTDMHAFDK